jgi:hypothetical protein
MNPMSEQTSRHVVRGFPVSVINTRPDIETGAILRRLESVLDLIAATDPRRYRRLQRDLAGFRVERFACRGAFFPAERACLTELTFLANASFNDGQIAASIVHEGMHARVHAAIRRPRGDFRAREERLCRLAELEFGRRLSQPDGAAVVERAEQSLAMADAEVAPAVDWSEAARRTAEVDAEARRGGQA